MLYELAGSLHPQNNLPKLWIDQNALFEILPPGIEHSFARITDLRGAFERSRVQKILNNGIHLFLNIGCTGLRHDVNRHEG